MPSTSRRSKVAKPVAAHDAAARLDRILRHVVDAGLAGCIFVVPLLMGGRQALGRLALVSLAVIVAVAWAARQIARRESTWRRSSAEILILAAIALLVLQIAPLPPSILAKLSPHTAEILPLWGGANGTAATLGTWPCISMTPAATRDALVIFLAYAALFVVTLQRVQELRDVERLLRWVAISALVMGAFGLVQLLTSNGKFFWFYEHPFADTLEEAKGSFTNRNHFAHFLALGIGPLIWWLQETLSHRRQRRPRGLSHLAGDFYHRHQGSGLRAIALGVVLFAGLLSLSRGGVSVMFLAAAISVAACYRAKTLGIRFVLSLGAVGLLIAVLLTIHGYDRVSERLDDLGSGSIDAIDHESARRTIWAADLKASRDYALLGAGAGSHVEVCPMYLDEPQETEYTHAENGPLQVLLETGSIGLTLMLAGVGICMFWCLGALRCADSARMLVCAGAIFASLAANLLHSMADFVWYVPGCMALVAILAGCSCRIWQLAGEAAGKPVAAIALPRFAALAAAPLLLLVGTWMIAGRVGPMLAEPSWDRYQIMSMISASSAATTPLVGAEAESVPSQDDATTAAGRSAATADQISLQSVTKMIDDLELVVRFHPDHARAHMRLAAAYLQRFDLLQVDADNENAMPLAQIRDAATQARSTCSEAEVQQWLARCLGRRRPTLEMALQHARRGLALCPLQGEGYLHLAELSFLEGADAAAKTAYIDQALRVRAYDGAVLFEAGREAWLAGDFARGIDYWQRSFRSGRTQQKQLIGLLAGRVPVAFILETFAPDLYALRILHARYRELDQPEPLEEFRRHYARVVEQNAQGLGGKDAAAAWLEGAWVHRLMGDGEAALRCAQNAFQADQNDYNVRHGLALALVARQQYAEAEEQLSWCLKRRPGDADLQRLLRNAAEKRVDAQTPVEIAAQPGLMR